NTLLGLGVAQFTFSKAGWLLYIPGGVFGARSSESTLVWVDRQGEFQQLPYPPRVYAWPRLAPKEQKLAVLVGRAATDRGAAQEDIWIYDLARTTQKILTSDGIDGWPLWTPDGKHVTFTSNKFGPQGVFWKLADGSGPEEQLIPGEHQQQIPRS